MFPEKFIWGAATASYQIEGGCRRRCGSGGRVRKRKESRK